MRILISPTAFKGTLTPAQAAKIILRGAKKHFPGATFQILPLADGGDGTLEVLSGALGGKIISSRVEGPLGKPVKASWAIINKKIAVIEMARASGLALIRGKNRIMEATSAGTGDLIRAALDRGCQRILLGVGGTASSDGGAGALQALGLVYLDAKGRDLSAKPKDLVRLTKIDWNKFDPRVRKADIQVLCDVRNPLLGKNGSARIFGPQKGATRLQVRLLEKILGRWQKFSRIKAAKRPGSGAAGGVAFGLAGFAGARLVRGTPAIMKALRWEQAARKADVIITGEGRLDRTSFQGKVVGEIIRRKGRTIVVAVVGSSALSQHAARRSGLDQVILLKEFS